MKSKSARRRHEPVGSGAIESTCRQLPCRMERCGQFWSTAGDEALLCLEMFWRNERWKLLFPHAKLTVVSNNQSLFSMPLALSPLLTPETVSCAPSTPIARA